MRLDVVLIDRAGRAGSGWWVVGGFCFYVFTVSFTLQPITLHLNIQIIQYLQKGLRCPETLYFFQFVQYRLFFLSSATTTDIIQLIINFSFVWIPHLLLFQRR